MEPINFVGFPKIARLNREIVITEKIDGTNAQIFIVRRDEVAPELLKEPFAPFLSVEGPDGVSYIMVAGSRSRWIDAKNDNYGFGGWVSSNRDELLKLGPGHHFGEWWGAGIQRRYDQKEKHFSLFREPLVLPSCCLVVPVLYRGPFATNEIYAALRELEHRGSVAAPGFMKPEGIVIYHTAGNVSFKVMLEHDEQHKGPQ